MHSATSGMAAPQVGLSKKSTQDLLDRLAWLERRVQIADTRIGQWMTERANREEQIADVTYVLRERGIISQRRVEVNS